MDDSKRMRLVGGVDIGGTKIRWVVMRRNRVIASREIRTPHGKEPFVSALRGAFAELGRRGVRRAGVGFPGTVRGATIVSCHNLPFLRGMDIAKIAPRGMVLRLDNDARCFGRGEAALGAGRGSRRTLALIFGTGIGRSFARGGKLLALPRLIRPEAWEGAYQRRLSSPSGSIARFVADELRPLIRELSPDVIVIGGGLMRKPKMFALLRRALRGQGIRAAIRRSRLRQNGPAIGAALLA